MKLPTSAQIIEMFKTTKFTADKDFVDQMRAKSTRELVRTIVGLSGQVQIVCQMLDLYHAERNPIVWIQHRLQDIKEWANRKAK